MMNLVKTSLDDSAPITTQELALDYIAKRGSTLGATRDKRIQYAREILQKVGFVLSSKNFQEVWPGLGWGSNCG